MRRAPSSSALGAPPRIVSLLPEMWHVASVDATLQFGWCLVVLVTEYAGPFGMMGLISYIGNGNEEGRVPPMALAYAAMVVLGPLALNAGHGQANSSGWVSPRGSHIAQRTHRTPLLVARRSADGCPRSRPRGGSASAPSCAHT